MTSAQAWRASIVLSVTTALAGCSGSIAGEAIPPNTPKPVIAAGQIPTATDLCRLITPADFPVQGQLSPKSPELEEKFSPSCSYHVKTGGVGETFGGGLMFIPEAKLGPNHFKNRKEDAVSGKRVAIGQGAIKSEPGDCGIVFDSPVGLWSIEISDHSAPNRDGCASARHVAERVIPRVP